MLAGNNSCVTLILPLDSNTPDFSEVAYVGTLARAAAIVNIHAPADFQSAAACANGAALVSVTGSGSNYLVIASTGSDAGTLVLHLIDDSLDDSGLREAAE